jgi:flagellar biosynthesis/type III secretory pathway chaperone
MLTNNVKFDFQTELECASLSSDVIETLVQQKQILIASLSQNHNRITSAILMWFISRYEALRIYNCTTFYRLIHILVLVN